MACTVQYGPYYGFTLSELQTEQNRYKAAMQKAVHGSGSIQSASVNGRSFTYGNPRGWSFEEWQAELQDAMAQLDPCVAPLPKQTRYAAR